MVFVLFAFYGIALCGSYYVLVVCYPGVLVFLLCAIVGWSLTIIAIGIGTSFGWLVLPICVFGVNLFIDYDVDCLS